MQAMYLKPAKIFARHLVETLRKKNGETLEYNLDELPTVGKDNFRSLTVEEVRDYHLLLSRRLLKAFKMSRYGRDI